MESDELAGGSLVRVLPDWAPQREVVHAVYASRRGLLPSVRALIDHLAERFRSLSDE
jgi:DNA-binding transcriptional LysR family regulator